MVLHENATVDFSIVLLKIIHVPYVHRCYIHNLPQPSQKNENLVQFRGLKLLFIFKIWSYRIVFDVIKKMCANYLMIACLII